MILAVETSSDLCSVALLQNDKTLVEYSHELPLQHAAILSPMVSRAFQFLNTIPEYNAMTLADLKQVVVALGPGSFTGLRIGLSYVQGLCFSLGLPVSGVSNAQLLAGQSGLTDARLFTIIDARRSEYYLTELFRTAAGYYGVKEHRLVKTGDLAAELPESAVLICPAGVQIAEKEKLVFEMRRIRLVENIHYSAAALGRIGRRIFENEGGSDPAVIEPLYIRPFSGVY